MTNTTGAMSSAASVSTANMYYSSFMPLVGAIIGVVAVVFFIFVIKKFGGAFKTVFVLVMIGALFQAVAMLYAFSQSMYFLPNITMNQMSFVMGTHMALMTIGLLAFFLAFYKLAKISKGT
ncbi:MAG: hypothetical protein QW292_02825 [Candidatus Parvarchaeota archaeon]